ncbi:Kelch-like protein 17 [Amycolatopsis balhimycina DSM 5908]|uniref:Kelch-like protein 17 n=2 Tax=Amycolatopsis balhimycina TaxID=208443 RepID=A0A428WMW0_AMYBA|nr:Kelch-like protein 17 [Amycolatopsis balhimycina DSM 5908]
MATLTAPLGTWTGAHDLPAPAAWYGQHDGAVPLDHGIVLVAGGADAAGAAIGTAATLDTLDMTAAWIPTGIMRSPRQLHTLTRLQDGTVLAAGGLGGSSPTGPGLGSAEIYHPDGPDNRNQWTPTTGTMITPRWGHSAVLLDDGSVLVAGGSAARPGGSVTALRSAERYTPSDGKWHEAPAMTDARTGHTAVALDEGMILVVGGVVPVGVPDDPALAFCELYDSGKKLWAPTGALLRARRHHQATRLSGTTVLVTGGTAPGSPGTAPYDPFSQRATEVFELHSGKWTEKKPMPAGRAFHRAVPVGPGRVLVVGGASSDRDEAGYRSAFVYDAGHDDWTVAAGLGTGRWSFAAAPLDQGGAAIAGGVVRSGLAAADPVVTELTPTAELFAGGAA